MALKSQHSIFQWFEIIFVDFSLATWLTENSITDTGTLEEVFVSQLLYKLGIDDYMKDPQCDRNQPPYQPANNMGWNLDSKLYLVVVITLK